MNKQIVTSINKRLGFAPLGISAHVDKVLSRNPHINRDNFTNNEINVISDKIIEQLNAIQSGRTLELDISSIFDIDNISKIQSIFNPVANKYISYVSLDSDNRIQNNSSSRFQWSIASRRVNTLGTCVPSAPIKDIIEMRLYQANIPSTAAMFSGGSTFVSIEIEELNNQAVIATNKRFHFLPKIDFVEGTFVGDIVPLNVESESECIFTFENKITSISTITLIFGDPTNVITFDNPARFVIHLAFTCFN